MKITVIGVGYVGLVTGACLAEIGHRVTCLNRDKKKSANLQMGKVHIYEPGLDQLVKKNIKAKRLSFTTDYPKAVKDSGAIFIAVGTPSRPDGQANLDYVFQAAEAVSKSIYDYKVIVDKSTVPVGTGKKVKKIIQKHYTGHFDIVSCPEFLREGSAIRDFLKPDRIVIGSESKKATAVMREIFRPIKTRKLITNIESAELIKYASNAFLATKISFINEISNICDIVGADVKEVAYGMGLDKRIGSSFLRAGVGYGGSCFPKDVSALNQMADHSGYKFRLLKAVIEVNNNQRKVVINKAKKMLGSLKNKKVTVLGLAFKDNTDDIRESASIDIINLLQKYGALVTAYDPVASVKAKKRLQRVKIAKTAYNACLGAELTIIATEWPEFKTLKWLKIKGLMKSALVIDGRNLLDQNKMRKYGFRYSGIGR